jgi:hypothetical protein
VFKKEESQDVKDDQYPEQLLFDHLIRTRSGRVSRPLHKYVTTHQTYLQTQAVNPLEYLIDTAKVIAKIIIHINQQFSQTFSLNRGIKEFRKQGHKAAYKEMKQLHYQIVFIPICIKELTSLALMPHYHHPQTWLLPSLLASLKHPELILILSSSLLLSLPGLTVEQKGDSINFSFCQSKVQEESFTVIQR